MNKKGISPLIAAVLLIAFTMAIAGIMASWATTFSSQKLGQAASEAGCIGALDMDTPSFTGTNLSIRIRNVNEKINLTDIRVSIIYSEPAKSNLHKDILAAAILQPHETLWFINNTGDATKPGSVEVVAGNCIKYPVSFSV